MHSKIIIHIDSHPTIYNTYNPCYCSALGQTTHKQNECKIMFVYISLLHSSSISVLQLLIITGNYRDNTNTYEVGI